MKILNRISPIFLMGLSVLIGFGSIKLGIGTPGNMGPGFMPFLASALLFILSLLILKGLGGVDEGKKERPSTGWKNLLKPGILIIALCVYMLFLNVLGYLLTAFLLMSQMLFISEPKKWYMNIALGAIIAILSFTLFKWLQVQLPTGVFHIGW